MVLHSRTPTRAPAGPPSPPVEAPQNLERAVIAGGDALAALTVASWWHIRSVTSLLVTGALLFALLSSDHYRRPRVTLSALAELPQVLARCALPLLLVALDAALRPVDSWVFRFVVALTAGIVVGRFASFAVLRSLRRRGRTQPALILGAGEIGHRIEERLRAHPEFGLRPVGVIDDLRIVDAELRGSVDELPRLFESTGATRLIIAFGMVSDMTLIEALRSLSGHVEVFVVPRLFELGSASGDPLQDELWDTPLVWMRRSGTRESRLRSKRMFDVVVSSLMLLAALPVLVTCALAVRLTSRGPVLFRQRRVGRHGTEFNVLKFRSMLVNDDSDTQWNVRSDARVTRVGRILRRTSLDELPQLFNVLAGDMSLVGPRPERPHFVEEFGRTVPHYQARHRSPVGLTGWAQVNGLRGDTSIEERVRFDNFYIEHWSMWRDLVILARTARAALRGG